jgi:8-oxo-dGTP pyrophosphatase MutT (NUDIX family)
LKNAFWEKFVPIQAAGGLVSDQDGNFLMMFRRNKWDLPKGKVEVNEDVKSAAEREVKEETGISQLETGELLTITYHTYDDWGDPMLKETYWYSMKASSEELLVPQTEEDITEVGFYKPEQIKIHCLNTFPSILDVLIKGKLL